MWKHKKIFGLAKWLIVYDDIEELEVIGMEWTAKIVADALNQWVPDGPRVCGFCKAEDNLRPTAKIDTGWCCIDVDSCITRYESEHRSTNK